MLYGLHRKYPRNNLLWKLDLSFVKVIFGWKLYHFREKVLKRQVVLAELGRFEKFSQLHYQRESL